ncbi:hypothetical protein HAX54_008208, partial [Datura stramonium]|nr:hypothetical protein [Datura stramonium]
MKEAVETDRIHPSQEPHGAKEKVPDNPKGRNPQNPKEKGPQNPNEIVPQNPKRQVQNQKKQNNGKTKQLDSQNRSMWKRSPLLLSRGKVDGQEDVPGGLRAKPNAQKRKAAQKKKAELEASQIASLHDKDSPQNFGKEDIDEADHFIYDHPQDATSGQNISDDQNPTPIACDPPNSMFAVCNLYTLGSKDFDADEYRQGLSSRGVSHFSPGSGTGPPATRTRLR